MHCRGVATQNTEYRCLGKLNLESQQLFDVPAGFLERDGLAGVIWQPRYVQWPTYEAEISV